jgi:predicted ATP-binding protein involved in virulence
MATKKQNSTKSEARQNSYFHSLELGNIKCFSENQTIDFSDGKENWKQWTIILGDNGTGKTTILRFLIIGVIHKGSLESISANLYNLKSEFDSLKEGLTALNPEQIDIQKKIEEFESQKLELLRLQKLEERRIDIYSERLNYLSSINNGVCTVKIFEGKRFDFVGYGASRKIGESSISNSKEIFESAFITLFDETAMLLNPEEWLLRSHYESLLDSNFQAKRRQKLKKVEEILKTILPDVIDIRFDEKQLENNRSQPIVEFLTPYGWVEAKDLSLGYRTSMAWMVDFASRMFDQYPESENPLAEPAVVLIDEIDLHLHPKWQRDLLDWLSDLCPNTQFIVTTHSPLIVQAGLEHDANIFVCRRNEKKDFVEIEQINEHLKTLRVDQILSGDYFEVPPRGAKTEKLLDEKEAILSKPKLTKSDEKRLVELDEKIGFLPVSENPEDNEVMQILKEAADWVKAKAK